MVCIREMRSFPDIYCVEVHFVVHLLSFSVFCAFVAFFVDYAFTTRYNVFKKWGDFTYKRIKELRKALGLTQQDFADNLGIKRGAVANYEIGRNVPIDAVVALICREFNVNESWLRDGSGDMFKSNDRHTDIARLTTQLLNEESDSFKNRFISMLANLNSDEWEVLEKCALELCNVSTKKAV